MNGKQAARICDAIVDRLPPDYDDAFTILGMVVHHFVDMDETGHNREHFIKMLHWLAQQPPRVKH